MKLGPQDFPRLQWSLLVATLMLALGATAVYFAFNAMQTATRERAAAQATWTETDSKLKQVRNEENEIKHKAAIFKALQTRGMIGEEQRLEWVELLKDIRDTRRLIDLQYEIDPQRRLDTGGGEGFSFYSSTMKLQLKLLHEEDLTRLLDDLRQRARALIQVKRCDVARLPYNTGSSPAAQLQADCQIDWITLRESTGEPGKEQGK